MARQIEISTPAWPEFMLHDPVSNHWTELYEFFPGFQFALVDEDNGALAAIGNSVPMAWEGDSLELPEEGWDWAFEQALSDRAKGLNPVTQCGLQIVVAPEYHRQGLSTQAVTAMRSIGQREGLSRLIVPARPTLKAKYPLVPMARYLKWKHEDGLPFDPWLRVHVRLGGRIVKPCERSMQITGTVSEWEQWAQMKFPESGSYVVPGALAPIEIDRARDTGIYVEPNVWVCHEPL
ncbi:MAG: hypothetical protein JXA57_04295 [Armatimonadetes bacterium]|nr:hypothetical protein [Armatimonadota bacterium]